MPTVDLNINSNISQLTQGIDQAAKSTDQLENQTRQYQQKSSQAFTVSENSIKEVNQAIKDQGKILKELTQESEKYAKRAAKLSADEQKAWKRLQGDIKVAGQEMSALKAKQDQLEPATSKLSSAFSKLGIIAAGAFSVGAIVSYGKEAVALAGKAEGIQEAFSRIGSPSLLNEIRAATQGTVSDLKLMQNAVKASNFDIPMKDLAKLFEFATKRAAQTGESVDYLVDSIILGIGRKSPLILDNLGISAIALREKFGGLSTEAAGVGDVAKAVGEIATEELEKMGNVTLTTAQKMEQMRASSERIKIAFGAFLISGLTPVIDLLNELSRPTKSAQEQFDELSTSLKTNHERVIPMVDEYDRLLKITDPSNAEQERMNELVQQIAKSVPTAITEIDEYGRVIGVSTEKAREFVDAQNALLIQKNAEAIEEWTDSITKAQNRLNVLTTKIELGKWMTDAGTWVNYTTGEMAKMTAEAGLLGNEILLAQNAIKLLSGEKIEDIIPGGEGGKIPAVIESLDSLKAKLKELKEQQSAAPLEIFHSFDAEIDKLEKQIALYEKKKESSKKAGETAEQAADRIAKAELKYLELLRRKSEEEAKIYDQLKKSESDRIDDIVKQQNAMKTYMGEMREELRMLDEEAADDLPDFIATSEARAEIFVDNMELMTEETIAQLRKISPEFEKLMSEMEQFAKDHPFAAMLGIENEEQLNQIKDFVGQLTGYLNELVQAQVEATSRIVEDQNQRIDEQQQTVNREFELKKDGLANNFAVEDENLKKMQKARDEAIKEREKAVRLQRTLSTVEAGISLVTASANIIKGFSGIPVVGVVLGLAAVAAMITGFVAASAKAKDATKMEHGGQVKHGLLTGARHSGGGIPINAEGGEWFINRQSSAKYSPLLDAINKDDQNKMKLFFDRKYSPKVNNVLGFDIDKSKKLGEIVKELKRGGVETVYGQGYIIEKGKGYTRKINLN